MNKLKFFRLIAVLIVLSFLVLPGVLSAQTGQEWFNACKACHTIGGGRLVGPDLSGISSRKDEQWLITFIKSSQTVIKSGDEYAEKLFQDFNKIPMPDQPLSDTQIKEILAYITASGGTAAGSVSSTPAIPVPDYLENSTNENIESGRNIFMGYTKLTNGGPSCLSCHNAQDVFLGGNLAINLTDAHGKLTSNGIKGILNAPPFPAMKHSYMNNVITDDEAFDLTSFLRYINQQRLYLNPASDVGPLFILSSFVVFLMFMITIGLVWFNRKKNLVKEDIFSRQIRTQ